MRALAFLYIRVRAWARWSIPLFSFSPARQKMSLNKHVYVGLCHGASSAHLSSYPLVPASVRQKFFFLVSPSQSTRAYFCFCQNPPAKGRSQMRWFMSYREFPLSTMTRTCAVDRVVCRCARVVFPVNAVCRARSLASWLSNRETRFATRFDVLLGKLRGRTRTSVRAFLLSSASSQAVALIPPTRVSAGSIIGSNA